MAEDNKGKTPPTDSERRRSVSVQDLLDIKENQERLDTELKQTNALVVQLIQGMEAKVIPMIDQHEQILGNLAGQLEQSFSKQTELMKGYIEKRLGAPIDVGQQQPPGQAQAQQAKVPGGSGKLDVNGLFAFARDQINQAGGIRNLLGGATTGPDAEIAILEKEYLNRAKLAFRDMLREALQLPVPAANAAGPVVVKAP